MKRLIKILGLFLTTTILYAQSSYNYTNIFFLDENHGWILGTYGNLWKTTNAGNNWDHIFNTELNYGIGIQFTSPTTGWLTKRSELFSSTDGGHSWQLVFSNPYNINNSNSYFINDTIGCVSNDTALFRTIDAGENWKIVSDTLWGIISSYFYNENLGFLIYGDFHASYLYKTTDLGNTWIYSNVCACGYGPIRMLNESEGYLAYHWENVVGVTSLIKTSDGGDSWEGNLSPYFSFGLTDFEFMSVQDGWVTTNNKNIFRTTNAGAIWDTLQRPTTLDEIINEFEFFNSNISYGISSNHIYFTNDGWVTYSIVDSVVTSVENQESVPSQFTLYQNYPNPFNPSTTIEYEIPKNGQVSIKVYNVLGKEVATLVNGFQSIGEYSVRFNANPLLTSGIYFYQLRAGTYTETRKMVLIR